MQFKWFAKLVSILLAVEMISWLAYGNGTLNTIACISLLVIVFVLSVYKLEYGVYAVLAELVIGSQGYLLSIPAGGFSVSLRLGLFLVIMSAWCINVVHTRRVLFFGSALWKIYIALWTFLAIGVGVGLLMGNSLSNIFFDWNGYLYFGAAVVFPQAIQHKEQVRKMLLTVMAGVSILAIQTLGILFLFSHKEAFQHYLPSIYSWIRDFRIGEITLQGNGFYRVFFQSHIYVLYILCIAMAYSMYKWQWYYTATLGAAVTMIFLSYSRSFWVSTVAVLALFAAVALWKLRIPLKRVVTVYAATLVLFGVGYVCALAVINLPLPGDTGSDISASSLISERTKDPTEDAGGSSRMALLGPLVEKNLQHPILGSGFGTTVTYATSDPRALADNPDGLYTTYAFEWGYLDLWLKLGIAGTAVYGLLVVLLLTRSYELVQENKNGPDNYIIIGAAFGLIALCIVHALTPYLNHPLGIGWILLVTTIITVYGRSSETT